MARNLTPRPQQQQTSTDTTDTATQEQTAERPRRERKPIGPGAACDRVLKLRDSFEDEALKAMESLQIKLNDRRREREADILSRCTDPEAARRMLRAREGE